MFDRVVAFWVAVLLASCLVLLTEPFVPWKAILENQGWAAWAQAVFSAGAIAAAVWAVIHQGRDQIRSARRVLEVFATELWREIFTAVLALDDPWQEEDLPVVLTELREMLSTTSQLRIELLNASRVAAWIEMRSIASMALAELQFIVSNLGTAGFRDLERDRRKKNLRQLLDKLENRLETLNLSQLIAHDGSPDA